MFWVSDRAGITAEASRQLAVDAVRQGWIFLTTIPSSIRQKRLTAPSRRQCLPRADGKRPIVISSIVNEQLSERMRDSGIRAGLFQIFISPLEQGLGVKSSHAAGRSQRTAESGRILYPHRSDQLCTFAHDDGQSIRSLIAPRSSWLAYPRCGKTPTSLYLGSQCAGFAAPNFPLTPDDFERGALPDSIVRYRDKLFGLTIARPAAGDTSGNANRTRNTRAPSGVTTKWPPR